MQNVRVHQHLIKMNFVSFWLLWYFLGIYPINVMFTGILISNTTTELTIITKLYRTFQNFIRSSGGVVVKPLACGARGPGFDSRSRRYDFRDWLSPASMSWYGWNTAEATLIFNTTNQPIKKLFFDSSKFFFVISFLFFIRSCPFQFQNDYFFDRFSEIYSLTRIEPVGEPYREVCLSPWKGNWRIS